jgi:hypothetical protein
MITAPVTQQALAKDDESRLAFAHQELSRLLAALEAVVRRPLSEASGLSALRLQLSRASRQRSSLFDAILECRIQSASPAELVFLLALRRECQLARSASSMHVARWTPAAITADWPGYCRASSTLRRSMVTQMKREAQLL